MMFACQQQEGKKFIMEAEAFLDCSFTRRNLMATGSKEDIFCTHVTKQLISV